MTIPEPFPRAIYVHGYEDFSIYRGAPEEMVSRMAEEMGARTISEAVGKLLVDLAVHQHLHIELPRGLDETELAEHFVVALLATKVAYPMAQA
jgi:hypothetical protein